MARSSHDEWMLPTGIEVYIQARELCRVGEHKLCQVWDGHIDVGLHTYLVDQHIDYTSLDPVRMGIVGEVTSSVIIWVGVYPGSLSADCGVEITIGLRAILLANDIEDVHVEIRESTVMSSAKLYKPAPTSNPTAHVREAFSTSLGMTICAESTPHIQGTSTLFFTTISKPGKLFLLAARHILFCSDDVNSLFIHHESTPRRNILLLGRNSFEARILDIESEIQGKWVDIEQFKRRLESAGRMDDPMEAQRERDDVLPQLEKAKNAVAELERFLADVKQDWKDPEKRIIGHVVVSPPRTLSTGRDGFTQESGLCSHRG